MSLDAFIKSCQTTLSAESILEQKDTDNCKRETFRVKSTETAEQSDPFCINPFTATVAFENDP